MNIYVIRRRGAWAGLAEELQAVGAQSSRVGESPSEALLNVHWVRCRSLNEATTRVLGAISPRRLRD